MLFTFAAWWTVSSSSHGDNVSRYLRLASVRTLFTNARLILTPEAGIKTRSLLVEDGIISAIPTQEEGLGAPFDEEIDCGGDFLSPGLVDIHCHGAIGRDTMEASDGAFRAILSHHALSGTTTAVLTTVAATLGEMLAVLRCAGNHRSSEGTARLTGVHLEGPYFSPLRRGAHRADRLRLPSDEETQQLLDHAALIRRMTLAPELPGALDVVRKLVQKGIMASAGHSDASRDEALAGFHAGIRQVTHLHNAMSSVHKTGDHREGLAEAALVTEGILCEVIADGVHVSPSQLREAWLAKGWDGIALVSDATAGAGLEEGAAFDLGGLSCRVEGKAAWTGEGEFQRLAGSTASLFEGVRTMVESVGVPLEEAIAMASITPARSLGIEHQSGSLEAGKNADLIRFDEGWNLKGVWIGGRRLGRGDVG